MNKRCCCGSFKFIKYKPHLKLVLCKYLVLDIKKLVLVF